MRCREYLSCGRVQPVAANLWPGPGRPASVCSSIMAFLAANLSSRFKHSATTCRFSLPSGPKPTRGPSVSTLGKLAKALLSRISLPIESSTLERSRQMRNAASTGDIRAALGSTGGHRRLTIVWPAVKQFRGAGRRNKRSSTVDVTKMNCYIVLTNEGRPVTPLGPLGLSLSEAGGRSFSPVCRGPRRIMYLDPLFSNLSPCSS